MTSLKATNNFVEPSIARLQRAGKIDHSTWGFAETAAPQALIFVADGDKKNAAGVLTWKIENSCRVFNQTYISVSANYWSVDSPARFRKF